MGTVLPLMFDNSSSRRTEPVALDQLPAVRELRHMCVITGTASGIGLSLVKKLVHERQCGQIVLGQRGGLERARRTVEQAVAGQPDNQAAALADKFVHVELDLTSFQSVRSFIQSIKQQATSSGSLSALVLNAAVVPSSSQPATHDGFDPAVQTNFLANCLLLTELGPLVEGNGITLVIGSEAHQIVADLSTVIDDGLQVDEFSSLPAAFMHYALTKSMLLTWVARWCHQQNHGAATVVIHDPGAVNSAIAQHAPTFVRPAVNVLLDFLERIGIARSPDQAAETVFQLLIRSSHRSNCEYTVFGGGQLRKQQLSPGAMNRTLQENLHGAVHKILT